jgi:glycosidase
LDRLAEMGLDWLWLLSVWQTGAAGREVSRTNPEWRREFEHTLADLREEDIPGSGFAIVGYSVHADLGGDDALARLRRRLSSRGMRLMLDFVPNHTALDHPWIHEHPDYFVHGTAEDLARAPANFVRVARPGGEMIFAHGRDPYFAGWPDTLQINYGKPAAQAAMAATLMKIAGQCDGVRCDMAMLVLPEIFERTWGIGAPSFWPMAIERVRREHHGFCFMAEVYWDLEWRMHQEGFDYAYDKRLYDRLRDGHVRGVRDHLRAGLDYQTGLARFLENHDEPRAAVTFPPGAHQAAAVITFLTPGLRFFHDGQFEGRTRRISPHLGRGPLEPVDQELQNFYQRLLEVLRSDVVRNGDWQLLECRPAWSDNWTSDALIAFAWQNRNGDMLLVAVNDAPHQSQCYVRLPFTNLAGKSWRLSDRMGSAVYQRDGDHLIAGGLYLDMLPWQAHAFDVTAA